MKLNFKNFLDVLEYHLFPSHCAICGQNGQALCPACRAHIPKLKCACPTCGQASVLGFFCDGCQAQPTNYYFNGLCAYGAYEKSGLKPALNALKYQGAKTIGLMLGKMLGRQLAAGWRQLPPDKSSKQPLIIPLPLHPRRQRERGYNQSLYIAQGVSAATSWEINNNLQRLSYQTPSAKLTYQERERQKKLFSYQGTDLNDQTIILIDDIFTTGATAQAASQALKQAGADTILVAVIAQSL